MKKIRDDAVTWLREQIAPGIAPLWEESVNPRGLKAIQPDVYLKVWAQSDPRISADFILFDEVQDSDGIMLSVLSSSDMRRQSTLATHICRFMSGMARSTRWHKLVPLSGRSPNRSALAQRCKTGELRAGVAWRDDVDIFARFQNASHQRLKLTM
jgi:hypothetical protein